jgi:hypothetical protein
MTQHELEEPKEETLLPPWIEERLGWIAVALGVCIISVYAAIVKDRPAVLMRPQLPSEHAHPLIVSGPRSVAAPHDPRILESLTLTIKNMGPSDASNLNAFMVIGESKTKLSGPDSLKNGEQGTFSTLTPLKLPEGPPHSIQIECWNCPLFPGPPPAGTPKPR